MPSATTSRVWKADHGNRSIRAGTRLRTTGVAMSGRELRMKPRGALFVPVQARCPRSTRRVGPIDAGCNEGITGRAQFVQRGGGARRGHATIDSAVFFEPVTDVRPAAHRLHGRAFVGEVGRRRWVIADGYISGWAAESTGEETVAVLNANDRTARVLITLFYADRGPAGPYRVTVAARRTLRVRLNDLRDPEPVPIATHFASVVESDVPIVVQSSHVEARPAGEAIPSALPFADA